MANRWRRVRNSVLVMAGTFVVLVVLTVLVVIPVDLFMGDCRLLDLDGVNPCSDRQAHVFFGTTAILMIAWFAGLAVMAVAFVLMCLYAYSDLMRPMRDGGVSIR